MSIINEKISPILGGLEEIFQFIRIDIHESNLSKNFLDLKQWICRAPQSQIPPHCISIPLTLTAILFANSCLGIPIVKEILNIFIAYFDAIQFFRGGRRVGSVDGKDVGKECGCDSCAGADEEVPTRSGGGWVRLGVKLGGADFTVQLRGGSASNYAIVEEGRCRDGGKNEVHRFHHG